VSNPTIAADDDFETTIEEFGPADFDPSQEARNYAEAAKFGAETKVAKLHYQREKLSLKRALLQDQFIVAADIENRIYRFDDEFTQESCNECYQYLSRWARMDINEPVEIQITSGGGDAWHGMALFDQILALRAQGLHVTITVRGTAASMAAILLQAADERVMGPSSFMLVHKASIVIGGTLDQIEDTKVWLDLTQNRVTEIFMERTGKSKRQVNAWFERKDSSFSPQAALEAGLIDRIG
jgi:ATP-dependent protease ClpP protease subunit